MIKWIGLSGLTLLAVTMWMMVACSPSSDATVEKVLKGGVRVDSADFKALTPAQQADVFRLARERNRVVVGDEKRY
jgi:hypothetical protein